MSIQKKKSSEKRGGTCLGAAAPPICRDFLHWQCLVAELHATFLVVFSSWNPKRRERAVACVLQHASFVDCHPTSCLNLHRSVTELDAEEEGVPDLMLVVFSGSGAAEGSGNPTAGFGVQEEVAQQEFLSRVLFMIGTFIALCLIFFP